MNAHQSTARVLTPLGLAVCLSLFGDLTLYAVLVTQLEVVGLSLGAVGLMLGVNRLIRVPGNPLAGLLFDRWGRRPLFLAGLLVGMCSVAGFGLVRGFWPFLVTRLGWGIAWTLINVGGMAMVLDVSTPANRGRLTGLYNAWVLAGLALGPLVGALLVDWIGFRVAMLACAGFAAVGLAVAALFLPETARKGRSEIPNRQISKSQISKSANRRSRITFHVSRFTFHVLRRSVHAPLVVVGGLYLIAQLAGEGVVLSTVSLLLQQRFGHSVELGGLALGVASAGGLLLALRSLLAGVVGPLAGHVSDGGGAKTPHVGRWPVIAGSLVAGMAGFALLSGATAAWAIVLGVVLSAVSGGAALAVLAALVGDLTPPGREGVAMGMYATAGDVGSTAGPFLAFALLSFVDLCWVYVVCAGAFLAGLGLVWGLRPTMNQAPQPVVDQPAEARYTGGKP